MAWNRWGRKKNLANLLVIARSMLSENRIKKIFFAGTPPYPLSYVGLTPGRLTPRKFPYGGKLFTFKIDYESIGVKINYRPSAEFLIEGLYREGGYLAPLNSQT